MLRIATALAASLLVACTATTPPRTADEVRAGGGWGMGGAKTERHQVNRSLDAVVRDLKREAPACLSWSVTMIQPGRSMNTSIMNVSVRTKGRNAAELTLQRDRMPRASHDPPGGYYVFVADLEKAGSRSTSLTMYGPRLFYNDVFAAILGWAEGRDVECPDSR